MNSFASKVFMWLFVGMFLTFATGYTVVNIPSLMELLLSNSVYLILAILEIVIVIVLSVRVSKMKRTTAIITYILYALLNGLTLSSIFIVYEMSSLVFIFLITSLMFLIFAVVGSVVKINLNRFGIYLGMALIAELILCIINIFLLNNTLNMVACGIGIIVFCGYIAYDVSRIKKMGEYSLEDSNMAIYMALQLYLDFINIFIDLLRLFGKERD